MSTGLLATIGCCLTGVPQAMFLSALTGTASLLPGVGGVALFDLIGRILGPVLVSLCVAVLKIYSEEVVALPAAIVREQGHG